MFVGCSKKIDNTSLTNKGLIEFLENEGYSFQVDDVYTAVKTHYVFCIKDDIWIQQIDHPYTGEMLTFHDGSLNDTHMDVMHLEKIDDEEDQEQYDAYLKWLDEYGITEKQLQDALEYYDMHH